MFDFSLEGGVIRPALQFWKRQDPLNLQQQTLSLWNPKGGNCKNIVVPSQDASDQHVQYGQTDCSTQI